MRASGATITQGECVAGRGELVAERGVGIGGIVGAEERADIAPEHVVERAGLFDRIGIVGTCHSRSRIETGLTMIVSVNEPTLPSAHSSSQGASPLFVLARDHLARLTLGLMGLDELRLRVLATSGRHWVLVVSTLLFVLSVAHAVPVWVGPGHRWRWQGSWRSGWRPTIGSRPSHVP